MPANTIRKSKDLPYLKKIMGKEFLKPASTIKLKNIMRRALSFYQESFYRIYQVVV